MTPPARLLCALAALSLPLTPAAAAPAPAPALQVNEPDRLARCANNQAQVDAADRAIAAMPPLMSEGQFDDAPDDLEKLDDLTNRMASGQQEMDRLKRANQTATPGQRLTNDNLIRPLAQRLSQLEDQRDDIVDSYNIPNLDPYVTPGLVRGAITAAVAKEAARRKAVDARRQAAAPYRNNLLALNCSQRGSTTTASAGASSKGCNGFTGRWDGGTYGIMTLSGGSGSYVWRGNTYTIAGSVSGGVLTGKFQQPNYPDARYRSGNVKFTLAPDGNSWSGTWTDINNAPAGSWSGTCIGP